MTDPTNVWAKAQGHAALLYRIARAATIAEPEAASAWQKAAAAEWSRQACLRGIPFVSQCQHEHADMNAWGVTGCPECRPWRTGILIASRRKEGRK